jgi:serine/threonine protein phosphatase PrpC
MGASTLANIGKSHGENQDTFVTSANQSGSKCFVGVFDGHGEKGGKISHFSRNTLTKALFAHKDLQNDPRAAIEGAYEETERQIERDYGVDAAYSGTTAVAVYQHRDKLFCANVGDSRAVLGSQSSARGGPEELKAIDLSSDHKPNRPDEKRRITAEGGIVQQSAVPVQTNGGGIRIVRMGPERVMDKSGFGGLAVSRSFGDLSLRPYVSSLPEVTERKLSYKDKVIVLGSDGVWDRISSQEAVNIAARHGDPVQAARMITNVARKRWQAETQGMLSDDITAVVVQLDHEGGPSTPSEPGSLSGTQRSATQQLSGPTTPPGVMRRKSAAASSEYDTVSPLRGRRVPGLGDSGDGGALMSPAASHRPVTGGPEGVLRYGDRLRRHKTASHLGLESLSSLRQRPATVNNQGVLPNHLLPAAGSRRP